MLSIPCRPVLLPRFTLVDASSYNKNRVVPQYCAGDKMEKFEMGGACGTYGGRERCAQGFGGKT